MLFQEKLNHLLHITGITNSQLSKALSVDPSLISRWRNGTRRPSNGSKYIENLSDYIVMHIRKPAQKLAITDLIGSPNVHDVSTLKKALTMWLSNSENHQNKLLTSFIDRINSYEHSKANDSSKIEVTLKSLHCASPNVYLGIDGKKEAVLTFLLKVYNSELSITLYLYSDESMSWLIDDIEYFKLWSKLLGQILLKGHRIVIIHTITRTLDEMLDAIEKWLPLYMTGAIEPYYTSSNQDSLFKRTLFIAEGLCSLTCESSLSMEHYTVHHLHENQEILYNQLSSFKHILSRCKPLMKIFTIHKWYQFQQLHEEFDTEPDNLFSYSSSLSAFSMPADSIHTIARALNLDGRSSEQWLRWHKDHTDNITKHLDQYEVHEIIALDLESLKAVPHNLFIPPGVSYSPLDVIKHLENMLKLMKLYPNYKVHFCDTCLPKSMHLSVKPSTGVILIKGGLSPTAFSFNQQHLIDAFANYILSLKQKKDSNDSIGRIESLIYKLTSALR